MFELFDAQSDLRITVGSLPHWFQPGATYFVTFRAEDSLPTEVADLWYRRRNDWLMRHRINPASPRWKEALRQLAPGLQSQFHKTFSEEYLRLLDKGHGECALRMPELAQSVAKSLAYFDGERYLLGDFVVMPNHVHLLVCLLGDTEIEKQCYSWKNIRRVKSTPRWAVMAGFGKKKVLITWFGVSKNSRSSAFTLRKTALAWG